LFASIELLNVGIEKLAASGKFSILGEPYKGHNLESVSSPKKPTAYTSMSHKLQNYLRTYRKRNSLSQDEMAFLLGCQSGTKVSRMSDLQGSRLSQLFPPTS